MRCALPVKLFINNVYIPIQREHLFDSEFDGVGCARRGLRSSKFILYTRDKRKQFGYVYEEIVVLCLF